MQTRKLKSVLVHSTVFDLGGGESMEVYWTRNNPYVFAYDPSSSTELYSHDDPPEVEGHLYQTTVWVDDINEMTYRRVAQDLTVLELS
jgi:hypothetical protein